MCVCVFIYIHTYIHTYMCVCMHLSVCVCVCKLGTLGHTLKRNVYAWCSLGYVNAASMGPVTPGQASLIRRGSVFDASDSSYSQTYLPDDKDKNKYGIPDLRNMDQLANAEYEKGSSRFRKLSQDGLYLVDLFDERLFSLGLLVNVFQKKI